MTDTTENHRNYREHSDPDSRGGRARSSARRDRDRGANRGGGRSQRRDDRRGSAGSFRDKPAQRRRDQDGDDRKPQYNPADLRSSNRPDRGRSPDIDDDVTGRELDKSVQRELGALDEQNRSWVQKHLVMAGRLIEDDPQLAFEHALAASRRGGRLAVVREAAGMTAYAAGKYSDALREFRTYRRISGDHAHLPEMVDSERALGRIEKALEIAAEVPREKLPVTSRVELAIVLSGIYLDQENPAAAVKALEIPELNPRRGFSYSPRLFTAYAHALEASGQSAEAQKWLKLSARAERALGIVVEPESEIVDVAIDDDESAPTVRARDVVPPGNSQATSVEGGDR